MDPELKSILIKCSGGLVMIAAMFTFVSMLSYLFTWSVDKDLLMNADRMSRGVDVTNMGGKLGYIWSHFLISDMLGLASFIFVFLMAALAYRLFFWQRHIGLMRLTFLSVSGAFILSLALSVFGSVRVFDGGLAGDAGRAVMDSISNLLGPIVAVLVVIALAVVWLLFASGRFARWFALSGEDKPVQEEGPSVTDEDVIDSEIEQEEEEPEEEEEREKDLDIKKEEKIDFFVLGSGSNVLARDEGYDGLVLCLSGLSDVVIKGNEITAEAGVSITSLALLASKNSLAGMEFFYGIPGSVGGAVYMNAGAYGGG
mgnify:CR=1 FL=1